MKKLIFLLIIPVIAFTFSACLKENHTVRFRNNYNSTLTNIVAGNARLGTVTPGQTSGYQSINTGNFTISGSAANGQVLQGGGSIKGKGKHKWTITLNSSGGISMAEDK